MIGHRSPVALSKPMCDRAAFATRRRIAQRRGSWLLIVMLMAGCWSDGSSESRELRQGTTHYKFVITCPQKPPEAGEPVTYRIFVRDRDSSQPIESGGGKIVARAGTEVAADLVKAPEIGQYTATVRFPREAEWAVGLRFHDHPASAFESTQWLQDVGTAATSRKMFGVKVPWSWRASAGR